MKRNLSKDTKYEAWDQIMMGSFNKVFQNYGKKYQKVEVVQNMKKMNFEQINQVIINLYALTLQFLSSLQSLNNCVDKRDFQRQVDSMDKEELHRLETELADKIIQEYEVQKKEIKEARYQYLKMKNTQIAHKINKLN